MKTKPSIRSVVPALALVLAACGGAGANGGASPAPETPAQAQGASPERLVETHTQGVFFDQPPLPADLQKVAQASRPTPADLQRVHILDPAGFEQPMPALSIEIPAGWTAHGQIDWDRTVECLTNNLAVHWSASSPDGLHEVSLLPRLSWQVESRGIVPLNPCPAARMASAREYLQFLSQSARPNARVIAYRDRPDLVAARQQGVAASGPIQLRHEAGELLIGYALDGQEMRETLIANVDFSELQGSLQATADTGFALRAPEGLLDFAVAERMRASSRIDRTWAERWMAWSRQRVEMLNQRQVASIQAWHQRRMNEITTAGILERGRIRQETLAEIGRINNQIVASRAASSGRNHDAFIDSIQEVQPWRDPSSGQQVDLSVHYQHAWQFDDGRQFLTNNASFDPSRDLGIGGHALQPAH